MSLTDLQVKVAFDRWDALDTAGGMGASLGAGMLAGTGPFGLAALAGWGAYEAGKYGIGKGWESGKKPGFSIWKGTPAGMASHWYHQQLPEFQKKVWNPLKSHVKNKYFGWKPENPGDYSNQEAADLAAKPMTTFSYSPGNQQHLKFSSDELLAMTKQANRRRLGKTIAGWFTGAGKRIQPGLKRTTGVARRNIPGAAKTIAGLGAIGTGTAAGSAWATDKFLNNETARGAAMDQFMGKAENLAKERLLPNMDPRMRQNITIGSPEFYRQYRSHMQPMVDEFRNHLLGPQQMGYMVQSSALPWYIKMLMTPGGYNPKLGNESFNAWRQRTQLA